MKGWKKLGIVVLCVSFLAFPVTGGAATYGGYHAPKKVKEKKSGTALIGKKAKKRHSPPLQELPEGLQEEPQTSGAGEATHTPPSGNEE